MIFDPKNKDKLDTPERRKILPPGEILLKSGLKHGDFIADIGCGTGYFSLPAASIVGNNGKVYACDISSEMLEHLKASIEKELLSIIKLIQVMPSCLPLSNSSVDFVLISNVLHEVEKKEIFLAELRRILKSRGKLILIEWLDKEMEQGPPLHERLSASTIENYLHSMNFIILNKEIISDTFNYYLAEKE